MEAWEEARIFISYRRSDGTAMAKRLETKLERTWPAAEVFRDETDGIGGIDWKERIRNEIRNADVVLVLISRDWGGQRIHQSQDLVAREVSYALNRDCLVFPLILTGAEMPTAKELPDELKALTHIHARKLREEAFEADFSAFRYDLEELLEARANDRRRETVRLEELNARLERGEDVDLSVFDHAVRDLPRFIEGHAQPGQGLHRYKQCGVWEVAAKRGRKGLRLQFLVGEDQQFRGHEETRSFLGVARRQEIAGHCYPIIESRQHLLLGLYLDGLRNASKSFQLTIPMHRQVGEHILGMDQEGVEWVSRNVEPREGGF